MRKGKNTGSPLSGCSVESTTFFACHNSGVILGIWFSLYDEIKRLALSSDEGDTSIILSLLAFLLIPRKKKKKTGLRGTLDLLYRRHGVRDPSMYSDHTASRAGRGFQGVRPTLSSRFSRSSLLSAHCSLLWNARMKSYTKYSKIGKVIGGGVAISQAPANRSRQFPAGIQKF